MIITKYVTGSLLERMKQEVNLQWWRVVETLLSNNVPDQLDKTSRELLYKMRELVHTESTRLSCECRDLEKKLDKAVNSI